MYNYLEDPRLEEVGKIMSAMFAGTALSTCECAIVNNTLVVVQDNTVLYTFPMKTMSLENSIIGFTFIEYGVVFNAKISEAPCYIGNDVANKVLHLYNQYILYTTSCPIVASYSDLLSNDEFIAVSNLKADDGMKFFKVPMVDNISSFCLVPMFSGLVKLNKGDTAGINIKSIVDPNGEFLLIDFNITKKKIGREYHMYYKTLRI